MNGSRDVTLSIHLPVRDFAPGAMLFACLISYIALAVYYVEYLVNVKMLVYCILIDVIY